MSETVISSSSNSTEKKYYNSTSDNSFDNSNHSNEGSSSDEGYTSSVPGLPLEVIQEQLRKASGSQASTSSSVPPSSPLDKEETVYSCAVGIHSKTSEQRLSNLRTWYQIPNEFNPRLPVRGEWCCNPRFGIGVYEVYFLGGFRLPLNTFARKLLVRFRYMSIQPQCMEINYLYANFVEGSIWRGSSSHCERVPFLLQALRNKSIPCFLSIHGQG